MILPIFVGEIEMKLPVLIDILISNGDSGTISYPLALTEAKGRYMRSLIASPMAINMFISSIVSKSDATARERERSPTVQAS